MTYNHKDLDSNQLTLLSLGSLCGMGILNLIYSYFLSSGYLLIISLILLIFGILGIKNSYYLLLKRK